MGARPPVRGYKAIMFKWLFGDRRPAKRGPEGRRVYAIGDIHGRVDLLQALQRQIAADAASAPGDRLIVYLGDYVDRGMNSREVIDLLLAGPPPGFEAVHLMGNHEDMLLDFTETTEGGVNWLHNGGNTTLHSYGVGLPPGVRKDADLVPAQMRFLEQLPPEHLAFYRGLRLKHVEGDYLFVHAGIRPGVPLDKQDPEDLLWIRSSFLNSSADHGYCVVHGHSITDEIDDRENRIGIDTGAYATGQLTALGIDGENSWFLQT